MKNFNFVDSSKKEDKEQIRESLTYWSDVWRRLKGNILAMVGLFGVIIVILFGFVGPYFTGYGYQDQFTDYSNVPPTLDVYQITDDDYVFLTQSYRLLLVSSDGELIQRLDFLSSDTINRIYYFDFNGEQIAIDYSYRVLDPDGDIDYTVTYMGTEIFYSTDTFHNMTFLLGSDHLGRDILTRL
ncbi:MAG: hypothetical protein PQJ44_07310, partial [Sphaerochaetaceae bacterium]|nr:hypothetical protein [Sphaerochaetaceae bacterium]